MQRLTPVIFLLLCVLGNAACTTFDFDFSDPPPPSLRRIDVKSRDQETLYPGVKASWAIFPKDDSPKKGIFSSGAFATWPQVSRSRGQRHGETQEGADATSEDARPRQQVRETLSLDLDYAVGMGVKDGKRFTAFDFIEFEGVQTLGPARVDYNYDLHLGSVFVRAGIRVSEILTLEALGGISISALDLQVRSAAARTTETIVGYGGNLGARLTLTPHPVFDFYSQAQIHVLGSPHTHQKSITLSTFEAGGQLHLTSNFSVFGGWRTWRYLNRIQHASDVEIKDLDGPTFGLLLRF